MDILLTGGTGFIGKALLPALRAAGHRLTVLTRQDLGDSDGLRYVRDLDSLDEPFDAVINLAGASLAGKRWNARYKQEIVASRIDTTKALGDYYARLGSSPSVWLNASAIGFYGPRGDETLTENASKGNGFSADLCQAWEEAAREAAGPDTRLCLLRLGVVLHRSGGAYLQMALPFRVGVANWVGNGRQYLSWIHRDDVVAAMLQLLGQGEGVFNLTAPAPITSREFCSAMQDVHSTFFTLPMPATVMRLMVGEMANELLLTGQRVIPERLEEAGFTFTYRELRAALAAIEGRS